MRYLCLLCGSLSCLLAATPGCAQPPFAPDSTLVAASSRYTISSFKQKLLGRNYRREWSELVRVPILNLSADYGGLTPLKLGGGMQTKSLRLSGADGREYVLRSVEKNTEQVLMAELRHTLAAQVVQDQISASHPYAALMIPPLAEAAGVGHTQPRLVWVPTDAQLGEFRGDFAGTLALLEERDPPPPSSFAGLPYPKPLSTEQVLAMLQTKAGYRVDQRAVLRARLFDMFLGDWDRHDDQWRWWAYPQESGDLLLRPVPRDRDQAFFVNQGLLPNVASRQWALPKFQGFDGTLRDVSTFNFNARYFDRSFLNELPWAVWEQEAASLQASLTDASFERAVALCPTAVARQTGPRVLANLRASRAALPGYAARYYRFLARQVAVVGSNEAERIEVAQLSSTHTRVRVYPRQTSPDTSARYSRVFDPAETSEVRVYGRGGADLLTMHGEGATRLRVRLIGGPGEDTLLASGPGARRSFLYDAPVGTTVLAGPGVRQRLTLDTLANRYDRQGFRYPYLGPLLPWAYNADDGVFLGLGVEVRHPGFHRVPWAATHRLTGNIALQTRAYTFRYAGDFIQLLGPLDVLVRADWQAPNYVRNFFGLGNETDYNQNLDISYYRVRFRHFSVQALLQRRLGAHHALHLGPTYEKVQVEPNASRFIGQWPGEEGTATFARRQYAGLRVGYTYDRRDSPLLTTRGLHWLTELFVLRGVDSNSQPWNQLSSEVAGYWPLSPRFTLAARVGGVLTTGRFDFLQGATLGGLSNLRGYRRTRFTGEHSLYHNLELRTQVGSFSTLLLAAKFGVLGFHDVGRVWVDGDASSTWHRGYGGGLWLAPFNRVVVSGVYGFSREDQLPLLRLGFLF